jgi:putative peptidoglycan lipid II flippase
VTGPSRRDRRRRLAALAFPVYALTLATLTHWPRLRIEAPIERPDIFVHAIAFGLWTALLMATGWLGRPLGAKSVFLATVAGACVATVDEASQALPGLGRTVDRSDLWANLIGVGAVGLCAGVWSLVRWVRGRTSASGTAAHATEIEQDDDFLSHARTFASFTLASRVLGLTRDAIIALVLGASAIASSFFTAFVIPNVFRRLFGEGALTAAFIPEYTRLCRDDPPAAARFASLTSGALAAGLGGFVILAELVLLIVLESLETGSTSRDVVVLTMIMLPFMPLVCVTALLGAMLQVRGRFSAQAGAPILLNVCLITAACATGIILDWSLPDIAIALGVAVTVAGVLQLVWCLLDLRGLAGWTRSTHDARPRLKIMLKRMVPVLIGLGTVQIGVLIDALIAGLPVIMGTPEGQRLILGGADGVVYPLDTASAAVLYFGQRLYQLPLGVFAVAIATAVFPALARASDDSERFAQTLRLGLRTSLFIAVPASVGLAIVAEPLVGAVYGATGEGGLEAANADRVRWILLAYTPAIIAASISQVLTRAYYACDDMRTPMRIGIVIVLCNIALNIALIWPFAEAGLAIATSITAWAQVIALAVLSRRRIRMLSEAPLVTRETLVSVSLTLATAIAMAVCVLGVGLLWPFGTTGRLEATSLVLSQTAVGATVYAGLAIALKRTELRAVLARPGA